MAAIHRPFDGHDGFSLMAGAPKVFDKIDGRVHGEHVTLLQSIAVHSEQLTQDSELIELELQVSRALVGAFWLGVEDETFDELEFQIWDQDVWAAWPAVVLTREPSRSTFVYDVPSAVSLVCSEGELTVEDKFGWRRSGDQVTLKPDTIFRLKLPGALEFDSISKLWLIPLQYMIMAATARRTGIRMLHVRNSSWSMEDPQQALGNDGWLELVVAHSDRPPPDTNSGQVLFHRTDFPDDHNYDLVIQASRQNRFAIDQYASIRSGFNAGSLTKFVAIAQSLEALDRVAHEETPADDQENWRSQVDGLMKDQQAPRKFREAAKYALRNAHRTSLEGRLARLNAETGETISTILPKKTPWARDVATARNVIAHGLEKTDLLATDLRGIQTATRICELLFELRWLTLLGLSPERANAVSSRRGWYAMTVQHIKDGYPQLSELASREAALEVPKPE